ncbi:iron complex transport system ATP-binding protein [Roseivivax lentus]|uniref:Iron complex transport system ATP-binding protein n=1 Tax=Roseivivax lentus TaxID=633194 RepID=A0A1N7NZR1_9RHOB|nr:ABC transporter ATP-binding protein [Roseivivax lentus]SIT03855.1 iron complex transport system ATP-binding protein [Roseivivax lentus]
MSALTLRGLTVRRGACPVVDAVDLSVAPGEVVGLLGPNGAGKTTLMRGALGLIAADGVSSLAALPPRARARAAAWLPQNREIAWGLSVADLVALGRLPHGRGGTPADRAAIQGALAAMRLETFASRRATALSGGEQARVLIARALAQEAPLLMADEPIAGLDPAAQIATLELFAQLARDRRAVLTSLHDLNLAARHCTRLVLLDKGRKVADGAPRDVLSKTNLASVFRLDAALIETDAGLVIDPRGVLA